MHALYKTCFYTLALAAGIGLAVYQFPSERDAPKVSHAGKAGLVNVATAQSPTAADLSSELSSELSMYSASPGNNLTHADTASVGVTTAEPAYPSRFDLDIPVQYIDFGVTDINHLVEQGSGQVTLPSGYQLHLRTIRVRHTAGKREGFAVSAVAEDPASEHPNSDEPDLAHPLPSTITVRGSRFFATLATPEGVYRLQGDAQRTRILSHRALDQRTISQLGDFRHAP